MALRITGVSGAAAAAGIPAGGRLVGIDGEPVLDFIDYNWFSANERLKIEVETDRGRAVYTIGKGANAPIGLDLEGLYPEERRCANRCVFCFVDQQPEGLRDSLYLKDDDWRYSVLFGNYITLTNVSGREFERILRRKPSPLYVSVHATDGAVRARMMGNPEAFRILEQLRRITGEGIAVHCQVVLVPGMNDGPVLEKTLEDLFGLYPGVRTVAVVPVGLTAHRQGLAELRAVGAEEARAAVEAVRRFSGRCVDQRGAAFAFAADEMYERAGLPPPRYRDGEHTPQLANGVGLISGLLDDFEWALGELPGRLPGPRGVTLVTGVSAFALMEKLCMELMRRVEGLTARALRVENRLFGSEVTVAGLISGGDILASASGQALGCEALVPQAALRAGEDAFLDGMTLPELADALGVPVRAVPCDGAALAFAVCGLEEEIV